MSDVCLLLVAILGLVLCNKTSQAMVKYREEHGDFKSVDELFNVKRA